MTVRHVRARRLIVAFVLAVLALSVSQDAGAVAPKRRTYTVVIEGTRFLPETVTVKPGDTIVWVNKDLFPHSATSGEAKFDSAAIAAGASWKYTAKTKGDFAYVCIFHPTMKGRLRVQ